MQTIIIINISCIGDCYAYIREEKGEPVGISDQAPGNTGGVVLSMINF